MSRAFIGVCWLMVGSWMAGCSAVPDRIAEVPTAEVPADWHVVGSYSTRIKLAETNRNFNIQVAVERLNGLTIPARSPWSFNAVVGDRTLDRGWRLAASLAFDGPEPAAGGGICQVSSTVYNAALLADLAVSQRHPHSRPVPYIALGRDATVAWGIKDLRLENPHPFPLKISARVVHDRLVVALLAPSRLTYEVRIKTGDYEPASPRREYQVLENPDRIAVGGVWVKLYRQRLRDGSIYETERVGRSTFYPYKIEPEDQ